MSSSQVPREDIQAKCPMRAVQVIPEDLLDDQEIQRLLESISKIKKKYARTNSSHSMDTSKEHNEQKNGNKSTCYSASVIILTIVFVVLLFVTILVVCSSLPYVNPHTRKVDASSEALEAEETLAVIVLMCLWCCLAFVLHLVCKYSRSSDKTNDCSSRMEP